jgi:hypothetical protein
VAGTPTVTADLGGGTVDVMALAIGGGGSSFDDNAEVRGGSEAHVASLVSRFIVGLVGAATTGPEDGCDIDAPTEAATAGPEAGGGWGAFVGLDIDDPTTMAGPEIDAPALAIFPIDELAAYDDVGLPVGAVLSVGTGLPAGVAMAVAVDAEQGTGIAPGESAARDADSDTGVETRWGAEETWGGDEVIIFAGAFVGLPGRSCNLRQHWSQTRTDLPLSALVFIETYLACS